MSFTLFDMCHLKYFCVRKYRVRKITKGKIYEVTLFEVEYHIDSHIDSHIV